MSYLKNLLIALDQLLGSLLGCPWPDMTMSAMAWLWHIRGQRHWPHKAIDALFFWDREGERRHCELSFESEAKGRQLPPECRK